MEYKIFLKKPTCTEKFEEKRDNVAEISIKDRKGNDITNQVSVSLSLSKDAMIELGKELIAQSMGKAEWDITHFYPARPNKGLVICYGIIIHPNSAEPIIGLTDQLNFIDNYIKGLENGK